MERKQVSPAVMYAPYGKRHKEYLAQQNEAVRQTIEAGYHCAWSTDEIMHKLRALGSTITVEAMDKLYHAYSDCISTGV